MKIVKTKPLEVTVALSESVCNTDKFFGVDIKGNRYFIIQSQYKTGTFDVVATTGTTRRNGVSGYSRDSLFEVIEAILDAGNEVHVFDTFKELAAFLLGKSQQWNGLD